MVKHVDHEGISDSLDYMLTAAAFALAQSLQAEQLLYSRWYVIIFRLFAIFLFLRSLFPIKIECFANKRIRTGNVGLLVQLLHDKPGKGLNQDRVRDATIRCLGLK